LIILSFGVGLPWGAVGVACASSVCIALFQAPLLCWAATREGPVGLTLILRSCLPFVTGGLAAAAALLLARAELHGTRVPTLATLLALSYAVSTAVTACSPGGLRALGDVWSLRTMLQRAA
jgi:hypothetical protein